MQTVMVLGGGPGTELRPLTDMRAEPAMPFAGLFRLIDFPISNCINSGGCAWVWTRLMGAPPACMRWCDRSGCCSIAYTTEQASPP